MSMYTTGELAKLCGVTVRTVQYYDTRGILTPSELSEGGRRLYSEEDLRKLRIICFLRGAGLSLSSIAELFEQEAPGEVITVLLQQQEDALREEIRERQDKLRVLGSLSRELRSIECFSVESIGDIADRMESRRDLIRVYRVILALGIPLDLVELAVFAWCLTHGIWWPFAAWILCSLLLVIPLFHYYLGKVAYICPKCHTVFRPRFPEAFWARHTLSLRKLTCTACGNHGFCIETYYDPGKGENHAYH